MLVAIPVSGSFNITALAWLPFSFTVLVINTYFISVVLGFACARFRDLQQIVATFLQLAFFLTPIIWVPDMLGQFEHWMYLNPLTSFVELIRAPILGKQISMIALLVSLSCTMLNGLFFFLLLAKYKNRVIFWV
jgi:ABC-type polysaccharide/polyol phosphate export permease